MKFLHLGDLHIGKIVNGYSMLDMGDQQYMLDRIMEYMLANQINVLLISGDVYDRADPPEKAIELVENFFIRLSEHNIKAIIISGNHDSDVRVGYGKKFFASKGIYLSGKYDGTMEPVVIEDEFGYVNFYMLPYVRTADVDYALNKIEGTEIRSGNTQEAIQRAIKAANINPNERNVILSHQSVVYGEESPELAGSESVVSSVGMIDCISSSVYDDFDYVALGHFHKSYAVGKPTIRYAGSLLKYSQKEAATDGSNKEKAFPVVNMGAKGDISVETVIFSPLHDMRCIKGNFAQLTDISNVTDKDDYIYITLTDEMVRLGAMDELKKIYPNAMKLEYQNKHTSEIAEFDVSEGVAERPFKEIMNAFYFKMRDRNISEESWKIMEEVAKEAGIVL